LGFCVGQQRGSRKRPVAPILRNACNGNGGKAGAGVEGGRTEIGGEIDAAADPLPSSGGGGQPPAPPHAHGGCAVLCCATGRAVEAGTKGGTGSKVSASLPVRGLVSLGGERKSLSFPFL